MQGGDEQRHCSVACQTTEKRLENPLSWQDKEPFEHDLRARPKHHDSLYYTINEYQPFEENSCSDPIDNVPKMNRHRTVSNRHRTDSDRHRTDTVPTPYQQRTEKKRSNKKSLRKTKAKEKCFRCGKKGHYKNQCSQRYDKKLCFRCGEEGHSKKNCRYMPSPPKSPEHVETPPYALPNAPVHYNRATRYFLDSQITQRLKDDYPAVHTAWQRQEADRQRLHEARLKRASPPYMALMALNRSSKDTKTIKAILDSGASHCFLNIDQRYFDKFVEEHACIQTCANEDESLFSIGHGDVHVQLLDELSKRLFTYTLKKALCVPGLRENLLSTRGFLTKEDNVSRVEITSTQALIKFGNRIVKASRNHQNLLELHMTFLPLNHRALLTTSRTPSEANAEVIRFHREMGHLNLKAMKSISKIADMVPLSATAKRRLMELKSLNCNDCIKAKASTSSLPVTSTRPSPENPGDIICTDSIGPFRPQRGGFFHLQVYLDIYSKKAWVFRTYSTNQRESLDNLRELDQELYNRTGRHIQVLRCDNGSEYDNTMVREYCKTNGITLQFCVPYRKGQNGHAERFNRTLTEAGIAQLSQSGLPYDFLFDSCIHFNFTRNHTPAGATDPSFGIRSPHERYYASRQAPIQFLPFGCLARPTIPPSLRVKHESRTEEAIFLGYHPQSKGGYLIYRPTTRKVITRDEINPDSAVFPGIVDAEVFEFDNEFLSQPDQDYEIDFKEHPQPHSSDNRGGEFEDSYNHHNYDDNKDPTSHTSTDVLARTNKTPTSEYIKARIAKVVGKTEQEALSTMVTDKNNKDKLYLKRDLNYDLKSSLRWIQKSIPSKKSDQKHDKDDEDKDDEDKDEDHKSDSGDDIPRMATPQLHCLNLAIHPWQTKPSS